MSRPIEPSPRPDAGETWRPGWSALRINRPPRYSICERGWSWRPPPLPDHDLWFVIEGRGVIHLPDSPAAAELIAGSTFLFSPGDEPYVLQQSRQRLQVFVLHFSFLDAGGRAIARLPLPPRHQIVRDIPYFAATARRCELSFRRGGPLGVRQAHVHLEQLLLHLFDEALHPPASPVDARLHEAIEVIERDPGRRWSIDDLAAVCRLSRSQLTRRFTAATGLSPANFAIHRRIERATRLIEETDMTLSEIAEALGYESLFFFSRQYKQLTGRPPSQHPRRANMQGGF